MKKKYKIGYALAWYKPEQWELLKALSVDGDTLENTYFEWEAKSNERIPQFEKEGMYLEKMIIDVDELVQWCKSEGIPINGEARAAFANELFKRKHNQ